MASAKREAQNKLGNINDYINLKGLNKERSLANDVYNTNTKSFQNEYNDLLNTIATNRTRAKTDFGSGRNIVSENAYMQNRDDLASLASRGLSGGIAQLNKLGNRIQTGRQYSDLANTYYNTMNELDTNEKTYTNQYNTNMESAKNTLNATLADIGSREKAARNAYRAAVAQLAEQIQARRDANANAAAALAQQKKNYMAEQMKELKKDLSGMSFEDAYDYLKKNFKNEIKNPAKWLNANTNIRPAKYTYSSPSGVGNSSKKTSTPTTKSKALTTVATTKTGPTANFLQNAFYNLWR